MKRQKLDSRQGPILPYGNLFHDLRKCGDGCFAFQGSDGLKKAHVELSSEDVILSHKEK